LGICLFGNISFYYFEDYKMKEISVLTQVYNGERFIAETIQSVLDQSFLDFEYIIVDDGSTDRTREIIESFKDERIKYFYYKENKGYFNLHKVMNFGLKKCKGKYIARIDADDICYPNRLKVQYDYLEKNKDIYLIGSSAEVIDDEGNYLHKIKKKNYPSVFYKYHIAISNSFIHSSIMFRNEGHLYPSYNEHMFYCWLTYNKKRMKNIPDILVKYRINPKGMVALYGEKLK